LVAVDGLQKRDENLSMRPCAPFDFFNGNRTTKLLVEAVGIENKNDTDFKD